MSDKAKTHLDDAGEYQGEMPIVVELRARIAELEEALEKIASYEPGSQAPLIARAALGKDKP